jgi:hypothetical protein
MESIITSLAVRHRLSRSEVLEVIEEAFSCHLSRQYQMEVRVSVRHDLGLEAVAYSKAGGVILQRVLGLSDFLSLKSFAASLEEQLTLAAVCKQVRRYKRFERNLVWGEVCGTDAAGNLLVETEIFPGEPLLGTCPVNRIGLHERDKARWWNGRRAFHLRRVEPVAINGTPRTQVTVDRVSKTLTETLLRHHLGPGTRQLQLHCLKRHVGHKSIVLATRRLPREAIVAVDRELREQVEVHIVKDLP